MAKGQPVSSFFQLKNLRIGRKLALIVSVFSLFIFLLLLLSSFGMGILSDVRVCVSGKEIWAVARRDAVMRLEHYIHYGNQEDYQLFLKNQAIAIGDRKGFLEIKKDKTDFKIAEAGFIEGGNHPQEVGRIARLFKRFYWISYVREAIQAWENADSLLDEMLRIGAQAEQEVLSGGMTDERKKYFLVRIQETSAKTRPWEVVFDQKLSLYGRVLTKILVFSLIGIALILLIVGMLIARAITRDLMDEISQLQKAATKIAEGHFGEPIDVSSKDEIGDLARQFKQMALQREEAERKLSERAQELAESNKKMAEAERIKDDFFATVSHELRTPLTLVLTPLESLLMGDHGVLPEAEREILVIMHNNAIRLLQMVTGLLDFSKFEAGKMEVHREPTDVLAVTKSVLNDFGAMMSHKKIESHLESGGPMMVMMDRYIYERILFNLLSNAVKFTPEGGSIGVSIHWRENRLFLSVSDTGIGISLADQKRLFEKFRQVEGVSTRRFEGTGLGLALVKEFAGLLGGSVSVESTPKKGSMFMVQCDAPPAIVSEAKTLVRPKQQWTQRYKTHAGRAPATGSITNGAGLPKLLIAEDNSELSAYLTMQLQEVAQLRIAQDGQEALEVVREWLPDAVLSDVMMPKIDGLTFCRTMKSDSNTKHIPVILLTALTHREALLKGWEAGADEYLFKPFHPAELVARVKSVLLSSQERRKVELILKESHRQLELKVQERTEEILSVNQCLTEQKQELEKANQELDSFVYTASHDLRAPLRSIASFSEVLKVRYGNLIDEQGKGYLDRIEKGAARMSRLIDDLLSVCRLSKVHHPREFVSTQELLDSALTRLDFDIRQARVEILVQKEMPIIFCDKIRLEEVFFNLVSNAVKFSAAKRSSETLKVEVGCTSLENFFEFYVRDHGIGIDPSHQDRIFDIFWQLDSSASSQGSGVGLSIVKKIIQDHGGLVRIDSQLQEGMTFYFTIPHQQNHN